MAANFARRVADKRRDRASRRESQSHWSMSAVENASRNFTTLLDEVKPWRLWEKSRFFDHGPRQRRLRPRQRAPSPPPPLMAYDEVETDSENDKPKYAKVMLSRDFRRQAKEVAVALGPVNQIFRSMSGLNGGFNLV